MKKKLNKFGPENNNQDSWLTSKTTLFLVGTVVAIVLIIYLLTRKIK